MMPNGVLAYEQGVLMLYTGEYEEGGYIAYPGNV
jgi:hypothetical protein